MAPSRAEQDELHRAIVGGTDPTATARAFDLLLEPLKVRLRFRWPNMRQDELESWAGGASSSTSRISTGSLRAVIPATRILFDTR
jgi:hypothetical protein